MRPSYSYGKARCHHTHHLAVTTLYILLWAPSLALGSPATSTTTTTVATSVAPVITGSVACPIADCAGLVGLNSTCLSQKACVCASSSTLMECFPKLGNCTGDNAAEIGAELEDLCSTSQDWGAPFPWAARGSLSWGAQTSQSSSTSAASISASTSGTSTGTSMQSNTPTRTSSGTSQTGGGLSKKIIIAFSVSLGLTSFFATFGIVYCLIRKHVRSWSALKSRTGTPCEAQDPDQHIEAFPYTPHTHRTISQSIRSVSVMDDVVCSEIGGSSTADSHRPLRALSAQGQAGSEARIRSGGGVEAVQAHTLLCCAKPPKPPGLLQSEEVDGGLPPPLPTSAVYPSGAAGDATPNPDPSATLAATTVLPLSSVALQPAPHTQAANGERYVVLPWALGERILSTLSHADPSASPQPPLPAAYGLRTLWEAAEGDGEGSLGPPPEYDGPRRLPGDSLSESAEHDS
ncbi:hypothetical protein GY45DRAFT_134648 [Cubamyces sp. BRFM 1775]|nr:hypothetical protein GY45DRAFT_134648 [Cubamyces sp. BRFM 1775]